MSGPTRTSRPLSPEERSGTVVETDEEVRQALLANIRGRSPGQETLVEPRHFEPPAPPVTPPAAAPFRPTARPPVAVLTVFDDGKTDGEVIRIRDHRFVIGRTEGDFTVPIDGRVSSRHVEITHQVVGGSHRWVVTDLQSTHGTFVRVSRTALTDQAEFLVGNGRYRLDLPRAEAAGGADALSGRSDHGETQGWDDAASGAFRPPALTELIGKEVGSRTLLVRPEYWIGSDPSCPICRPDDPFCEPKHARVFRNPKGGWSAEHNKTQNGLWLRMAQVNVETMAQFQVGEQRFRLKVQ